MNMSAFSLSDGSLVEFLKGIVHAKEISNNPSIGIFQQVI